MEGMRDTLQGKIYTRKKKTARRWVVVQKVAALLRSGRFRRGKGYSKMVRWGSKAQG